MYHQISERPNRAFRQYSVTPGTFAAQMRWLAALGYRGVTLDDLLAHRSGQRLLPRKPIILTFDDGCEETVGNVVPVLEAHGFTAVFFLVAGLMGGTSRWLRTELAFEFPLVDWPTARWLSDSGYQCASHSMTHPRLAELGRDECFAELRGSRDLLEDRLGKPVQHLAYPYGSYNEQVRYLAREAGYESAVTVRSGRAVLDGDLLDLRRLWVPLAEPETLAAFAFRVHTSARPADWMRKKFGGIRRRLSRSLTVDAG
jgi:peptidoglycan/xylan/chitin deacetylase (PgdA/CDA1 family)